MGKSGEIEENARVTVLQNGSVIQNNVQIQGSTGGATDDDAAAPGSLRLQDHGNPVKYRNIWIAPLPLKGSDVY